MHRLERLTVTFQNSILHFEFTFPTPLVKTPINWLQSYNGKILRLCLEVILSYPRVQYNSKQNMASFLRLSTVNMPVIWAKEKNNCTQLFNLEHIYIWPVTSFVCYFFYSAVVNLYITDMPIKSLRCWQGLQTPPLRMVQLSFITHKTAASGKLVFFYNVNNLRSLQ